MAKRNSQVQSEETPKSENSESLVSNETDNADKNDFNGVLIEDKLPSSVIPSKEEKPSHEVLKNEKPKIGMSLKDSWKHPSKFKN